MAQHFLPDFGGWEVISASGSFGFFEGANAHQQYKAAKAASGWDSWYRENCHYSDFQHLRRQWLAQHETRTRRDGALARCPRAPAPGAGGGPGVPGDPPRA